MSANKTQDRFKQNSLKGLLNMHQHLPNLYASLSSLTCVCVSFTCTVVHHCQDNVPVK